MKSLFHSSLVSINQPNLHTPVKQEPRVTGSLSTEERTVSSWVISLHYINESQGSLWGNNGNALSRAVRLRQCRKPVVLIGHTGPIANRAGAFSQHFKGTFSQCDTPCFHASFISDSIYFVSIYFVYGFNIWHYSSKELTSSLCLLFLLLLQSRANRKPNNKQWQM